MWDYNIDLETDDIKIDARGDIEMIGSHLDSELVYSVVNTQIQTGLYVNRFNLLDKDDIQKKSFIKYLFQDDIRFRTLNVVIENGIPFVEFTLE